MLNFYKVIIDNNEGPVVICDLDCVIRYMNPAAEHFYKAAGPMVNKRLDLYMDEEMMSRVLMTLEWFKEGENNNKVFALHDPSSNSDMYMCAVRNEKKELIAFYGRTAIRQNDTSKEFDID